MTQDLINVCDISVCYVPIVRGKKGKRRARREFWALKNVSFDIIPGEILGVIGKNGSGKSTMLRVLAGIIKSDGGEVRTGGRASSLLAIGSSLMTELSGMDNIYLIGLQLGFQRSEIDAVCGDIVRFAELEEFIDQPVRTYSSGMRSKLSFSVAVHLPTEMLLIDELLSVGDMAFRQKSYAKMQELINDKNHTVVIVSHDLGRLRYLCSRVLWLDNGSVRMLGDPKEVIQAYQDEYTKTEGKLLVSDVKTPELLKTEGSEKSITVFWSSVQDATGYIIYRKCQDTGYKRIARVDGAMSDRYTDTDVEAGETYQYTVRAYRMLNGITDRSSVQVDGIYGTASAEPEVRKTPVKEERQPLSAPKLLGVCDTKSGPVLFWETVPEATGYVIYKYQPNVGIRKAGVVIGALSNRFAVKTPEAGARYTVSAYRTCNGVTDRSDVDRRGVPALPDPKAVPSAVKKPAPLATPGLGDVRTAKDMLTVTWKPVPGATGYLIYRHQENVGYKQIGMVVGASSDRFADKDVIPGKAYRYTVGAYRICNGATEKSGVNSSGISGAVG